MRLRLRVMAVLAFYTAGVIPAPCCAGDALRPQPGSQGPTPAAASDWSTRPLLFPVGTRLRITCRLSDPIAHAAATDPGRASDGTQLRPGARIEGLFESVDSEAYVLAAGGSHVRVRFEDVLSVELREPGNPGLGVIGGLAGIAGGLLFTGLACISLDGCGSSVLWLGMGVGLAAGATAGQGQWKTVPVLARRGLSVAIQPNRHGLTAGVRASF